MILLHKSVNNSIHIMSLPHQDARLYTVLVKWNKYYRVDSVTGRYAAIHVICSAARSPALINDWLLYSGHSYWSLHSKAGTVDSTKLYAL